jgi:DNA invertase Pin-like site-specific DNA recombinase
MYARYSSDLQRESSIEDQFRRSREFASRQGWTIVEQFVIADRAVSAASIAGRDGLQELIKAAKSKKRPFDCLLVDDTSRLARDLSDALRIVKVLAYHNVAIVSVSQGIDSSQANARTLVAMHGMMDEQFITDLAKKVHRGQEGRALSGYTTGGRVYGYNNVPIEDPTRMGKYGRPAVAGVRLVINPEQAAVVMRIFRMYADGVGQGSIAVQLNAEGVRGPNGPWSRYTIHEMLRNERYRGIWVWGRTQKSRNPETGRKVSRPTPESQWRRTEVSEWSIVPEELWQAVQERRSKAAENFHKLGGMTRTERGRKYPFSGLLVCGICGGSIVICAGGGERGYVKYGCHCHKQSGVCKNKLMIRQDRLEEQLSAALEQRIGNPATLDYAVERCQQKLRRRLTDLEREGSIATLDTLKKQRGDVEAQRQRYLDAIGIAGDLTSLTQRLRAVEAKLKRLSDAIAVYRQVKLDIIVDDIRDHVVKSLAQLRESMTAGDSARAKAALAKHVGKLVLTPVERDGRPFYRVSGNVSVQADTAKCRMQWVAVPGHHISKHLRAPQLRRFVPLCPNSASIHQTAQLLNCLYLRLR